jgi:hypothetical protein
MTYQGSGPQGISDRLYVVPDDFTNLPAGTYSANYLSGGPPGATLVDISPSAVQSVGNGKRITFTFNFRSIASGRIIVDALLNDVPWQGPLTFRISGDADDTVQSVPFELHNLPDGRYTVTYLGGGPPAPAYLDIIDPGPVQDLSPGGTIRFTLRFVTPIEPFPPEEPPSIQPLE